MIIRPQSSANVIANTLSPTRTKPRRAKPFSRRANGATSQSGPYTVKSHRASRKALSSPSLITLKRSPMIEPP